MNHLYKNKYIKLNQSTQINDNMQFQVEVEVEVEKVFETNEIVNEITEETIENNNIEKIVKID